MTSGPRHLSTPVLVLHALALGLFGLVLAGAAGRAGGLLVVIGAGVLGLSGAVARRAGGRGSQGSAAPLVAPPVVRSAERAPRADRHRV